MKIELFVMLEELCFFRFMSGLKSRRGAESAKNLFKSKCLQNNSAFSAPLREKITSSTEAAQ